MKISKSITWIGAALFAVVLTAGCNRNDDSTADAGRQMDQTAGTDQAGTDRTQAPMNEQSNVSDKIDDAAITAKVKTAIIGEPGLKALQIDVDTANGVVVLSGAVDSPTSVDRATQIAQAIEGVKSVDNRLTVRQG